MPNSHDAVPPRTPSLSGPAVPTSTNPAPPKTTRARRALTQWPDVLRAVQGDESRSQALGQYRAAGFGPDDFEHTRRAREAMSDALSRTEDFLELRAGSRRAAERESIAAVRRRLELELWA